jgi:hypothetical protein
MSVVPFGVLRVYSDSPRAEEKNRNVNRSKTRPTFRVHVLPHSR